MQKSDLSYLSIFEKSRKKLIFSLEIRDVPLKGRGIFSTRKFFQGEFVVEYAGDLITPKEAEVRDAKEEFFSRFFL